MTFFYDLNKRLAGLAGKQDLTEGKKPDFLDVDKDGNKKESFKQAVKDAEKKVEEGSTGDYSAKKASAGKDIGKPGKAFGKIAADAAKRYGSKERGEKVAGAVLAKLRSKTNEEDVEEGNEFSGALAKAKAAGAKSFEVDGKEYPVKEGIENLPGISMSKGEPADNTHWLDITTSKDKNFKVAKPGHELDGKTVTVVGWSKNGKSVVVKFEGQGHNLSPKDLVQRKAVQETKSKAKNAFDPEVARSMFAPEKGKTKTGHEVKDTGYSKRYTKKLDDEPEDKEELGDAPKKLGGSGLPKKKGRKAVGAGKGKKIGAKHSGTSKLHRKDAIAEGVTHWIITANQALGNLVGRSKSGETIPPQELATRLEEIHGLIKRIVGELPQPAALEECSPEEYGMEGDKVKKDLKSVAMAAKELHSILGDEQDLPEWVQDKITRALDYINSSNQYMHQEMGDEVVAEKAVSQQQQKFMGMAHAIQKGEKVKGASPELKKVAKTMKKSDVKDFAATKHKGLPKKANEEEVEETTDAPKAKKAKGGMQFGQGVYESMNSKLENMITESMSINVSMNTNDNGEPTKSINVNAEGADAEVLAQLLNLAGLHKQEAGCGCGTTPCSCEQVDEVTENNPDWPTDAETTGEDDAELRRWAGGLNGPKSTGQTTNAPFNRQPSRQGAMKENTDLGMNLYAELKQFKAK